MAPLAPVVLGLGSLLFLSSCGDDSSPSNGDMTAPVTGIFVGKVADTDAFIAVVGGSEAAVAAVVDGGAGIAEPFGGARSSEDVVLDSKNGAHLDVRLSPDGGSGSVTLAGTEHSVGLEPAMESAGLYRAGGLVGGEPVWILWVVLNNGEQRGAAGTPIGIVDAPLLDVTSQSFTVDGVTSPVADVQPDQPPGMIEDPGDTFAGGRDSAGESLSSADSTPLVVRADSAASAASAGSASSAALSAASVEKDSGSAAVDSRRTSSLPNAAAAAATEGDAQQTGRRRSSLLLAAFIALMIAGNLPIRPLRAILQVLTLGDTWNVFAPDPVRTQVELRASIEFSDGRQQTWRPPRAAPLFAALTYHWDAWAAAAALGQPLVARSVARWIATTAASGRDVVKVTLTRRWTDLKPPGSDGPLLWHESDFHVYDVPR